MDFVTLFAVVFSSVYTLYKKFYSFFHPTPKQLFFYDVNKKSIYACGFCGHTEIRIALNYFAIEGNYIIEINGNRLISFVDNVLEGTEDGYTYYLGNNYIQVQEPTIVKITDGLTESFGEKKLNTGEVIDFGNLITELI